MGKSAAWRLAVPRWFPFSFPYTLSQNADRADSTGMPTWVVVHSKFQIVRLPVEPPLSAFSETAYVKGSGDQRWNASLCAADSLITNVRLCLRHCLRIFSVVKSEMYGTTCYQCLCYGVTIKPWKNCTSKGSMRECLKGVKIHELLIFPHSFSPYRLYSPNNQ